MSTSAAKWARLERWVLPAIPPPRSQVILVALAIVAVAYLDYLTGPTQEFGLFYHITIIVSCLWFGELGAALAVPGSLVGYTCNTILFHGLGTYSVSNSAIRALSFITVAGITLLLRRSVEHSRQTARDLEASYRDREAILECLPDAVLLVDPDLQVRTLGRRALELLGSDSLTRGFDSALQSYLSTLPTAQGLQPTTVELEVPAPRTLLALAAPLSGRTGWVVALRDISELVHSHALLLVQERTLAVQETRNLVAAYLHDHLAQSLSLANMQLASLDATAQAPLQNLSKTLSRTLDDLRHMMRELRPALPDRLTFKQAVKACLDEISGHGKFEVSLNLQDPPHLDSHQEGLLLYVIREAAVNALRHSRAGHLFVSLENRVEGFEVRVEDDGIGFDPEQAVEGFGLQDMRDRARQLGARLSLERRTEGGTRVRLVITASEVEARG